MGIEPISSVWKTEVIATIPYPRNSSINWNQLYKSHHVCTNELFRLSLHSKGIFLCSRFEFVLFSRSYWKLFEGGTQNRTGDKGFAILCLTTWPCHHQPIKGLQFLSRLPERPSRFCESSPLWPEPDVTPLGSAQDLRSVPSVQVTKGSGSWKSVEDLRAVLSVSGSTT